MPERPDAAATPARLAWAGTALILAGQAFRLSPLIDAADGSALRETGLRVPAGYLLTAPFSALADLLTFASARQAAAWAGWLLAGYWLWRAFRPRVGAARAWAGYALYLSAAAVFLAWALLAPRPVAGLRAPAGAVVLTFDGSTLSVSAPPTALELPAASRDAAAALARRRGLILACGGGRGWSRAPYCWNVLRLGRAADAGSLEAAVLDALRRGGPEAVLVAARRRAAPSPGWRAALDPFLGLWTLSRCLSGPLAVSCAAWLWVLCGAWRAARERASRRSPQLPYRT